MERSLETLRQMMNISPLAQLLFTGETLAVINPEAQRMLPGVRPGDSAEAVFGAAAEGFLRFSGSGSILFPVDLGGFRCDVTVSGWEDAALVTITAAAEHPDNATMLSLAERVRQPMASILSLTPKLLPLLEGGEDGAVMERAAEVNQGLYRLLQITGNLELYARGRLSLQRETFDLGPWLQELMDGIGPMLEPLNCRLELQRPEGSCICDLDPQHLRIALLNLISNAVKFSKPGGTITLSCQRKGNMVWLAVRDQGVGIPADQMGLVFQRSEHRGLLPDPRWGVGMGLPVTRKIVEAHGGRLLLESREGQGTTVHLSLNARTEPGQLSLRSPVQLPVDSSGIDPVLVLLADVLPPEVFDTRGVD